MYSESTGEGTWSRPVTFVLGNSKKNFGKNFKRKVLYKT